jgi:uncharacterized protein (TIGR03435 family)
MEQRTRATIDRMLASSPLDMTACTRTILLIAGWIATAVPATSQEHQTAQPPTAPDWQTAAGGKMVFEVASIKPSDHGKFMPPAFALDAGDSYASNGGRFFADFPLWVYITFAYKLTLTPEQNQAMIQHLPKWVASDRFNIQAKAEGNPTKDQMRLMMQSLLVDRFQLAVHFETQELPVFALTLAKPGKLGPNLRLHADGPSCDVPDTSVFPSRCDLYVLTMSGKMTKAGSRNTTMDMLAAGVSGLGKLGRPVINQTGLSGRFDFTLEWMRERDGPAPPRSRCRAGFARDDVSRSFARTTRVQARIGKRARADSCRRPYRAPVRELARLSNGSLEPKTSLNQIWLAPPGFVASSPDIRRHTMESSKRCHPQIRGLNGQIIAIIVHFRRVAFQGAPPNLLEPGFLV